MNVRFWVCFTVFFLFISVVSGLSAQSLKTPLEQSGFTRLTTHSQMMDFLKTLTSENPMLKMEFIAVTAQGKNLPVIKISQKDFGADPAKSCVLIFGQQHGNEPSSKEAALMLLRDFAQGKLNNLLDSIDVAIVPMMNPDGNDMNTRRNGNNADLNRDHLGLLQPETAGLHVFFNKYNFIASMDVHEYSPYSSDWMEFGYLKNYDVQVGKLTNANVPPSIRLYQQNTYFPYILEYITNAGYSSHDYLLGGPPGVERIRHSTYDINDGRQSLGSLGTFSFIQEGINGKDSADRIEHRSKSQYAGILGFIEYIYKHKSAVTNLSANARHNISSAKYRNVAVRMNHVSRATTLQLNLLSVSTNTDTLIIAEDYRPVVEMAKTVTKPDAYLIPATQPLLIEWAMRHNLPMEKYVLQKDDLFEIYHFNGTDTVDFEGDTVITPVIKKVKGQALNSGQTIYMFPTDNRAGNVLVQALEPESTIGLGTYKAFEPAFKDKPIWPVIRLIRSNGNR